MIRAAQSKDGAAIGRIAAKAYQVYVQSLGRPPAPMVADFRRHIEVDWVIVFEMKGALVGYAILMFDQGRALLDNIAVDPEHQHSGIGRALIERAEQQAVTLGHRSLELYTNAVMTENIRWYEKQGFVESKRVIEDGFHRVYMRKSIDPKV